MFAIGVSKQIVNLLARAKARAFCFSTPPHMFLPHHLCCFCVYSTICRGLIHCLLLGSGLSLAHVLVVFSTWLYTGQKEEKVGLVAAHIVMSAKSQLLGLTTSPFSPFTCLGASVDIAKLPFLPLIQSWSFFLDFSSCGGGFSARLPSD